MNEIAQKKIYNFIDEYFSSNINYTHGMDDYGNDDPNGIYFYSGDFDEKEDICHWYGENYWDNNKKGIELKKLSPILILSSPIKEVFDKMFGNYWEEPFILWFKNKFNLEVKTIGD
jgi:hypothetical protein